MIDEQIGKQIHLLWIEGREYLRNMTFVSITLLMN